MIARQLFLVFGLTLLSAAASFAQQQEKPRTETVRGRVVAESTWNFFQACYHVCGLRLIVRLEKTYPEYVVVSVEYMDDRTAPNDGRPVELVKNASKWKFKATKEGEASLEEHVRTTDLSGRDTTKEMRLSAWRLLPGAESEILPFGIVVARYGVGVGKYNRID